MPAVIAMGRRMLCLMCAIARAARVHACASDRHGRVAEDQKDQRNRGLGEPKAELKWRVRQLPSLHPLPRIRGPLKSPRQGFGGVEELSHLISFGAVRSENSIHRDPP
jgi:hypothetical protein